MSRIERLTARWMMLASVGLLACACVPGPSHRQRWDALRAAAPLRLGTAGIDVWLEDLPLPSGAATFALVRIPAGTAMRVHSAASAIDAGGGTAVPAAQWRQRVGGEAVVFNAGFYHHGGGHVGWLKSHGQWAERTRRDDWYGLLVAGPTDPALPAFQLLDLDGPAGKCAADDLERLLDRYDHAMQTMMLFDGAGALRVRRGQRQAARSALALDRDGNLLFALSRGALTLEDLANALAAPHLRLVRAVNLDGGLEAQLAIAAAHHHFALLSRHGSSGAIPDGPLVSLAARALPSVWVVPVNKR